MPDFLAQEEDIDDLFELEEGDGFLLLEEDDGEEDGGAFQRRRRRRA